MTFLRARFSLHYRSTGRERRNQFESLIHLEENSKKLKYNLRANFVGLATFTTNLPQDTVTYTYNSSFLRRLLFFNKVRS